MKSVKKLAIIGAIILLGLLFSEFYSANYSAFCETLSDQSLLSDNADWQPQDYSNSQGIKAVSFEEGKLALVAHLVGQHENYSNGEVYLDFRYFPSLGGKVPVDLSRSKITAEVEVPDSFVGQLNAPNGIQVFVKDEELRSQYGTWVNIKSAGKHTATLNPTTSQINDGYTAPGFNPQKIQIIGIKLAIGTNSHDSYDGTVYVSKATIDPPLELTPEPLLPQSTPNNQKNLTLGGNWRIMEYGQNFGTTAWFPTGNGISKHPNFVRINLNYFRRAGVKIILTELLTDGRTMFDKDGHVIGYDDIFRNDIQTYLDLADKAGIKIEFKIFDYLIAGRAQDVDGVWIRGRSKIITNDDLKAEFMNKFLVPFLKEFGDHPALIGFDVINEPEWILSSKDGGDWENFTDSTTKAVEPIPIKQMNAFIADCIGKIRDNAPSKLVTVGVSIKFTSLFKDWKVDYFAVHHYPSMGDFEYYLPINLTGKPWSLEEFPTENSKLSISQYLDRALNAGATAAMLWNLSPGIDKDTFPWVERDAKLLELRQWVETPLSPSPTQTQQVSQSPSTVSSSPSSGSSESPTASVSPSPTVPELFLAGALALLIVTSIIALVVRRKYHYVNPCTGDLTTTSQSVKERQIRLGLLDLLECIQSGTSNVWRLNS